MSHSIAKNLLIFLQWVLEATLNIIQFKWSIYNLIQYSNAAYSIHSDIGSAKMYGFIITKWKATFIICFYLLDGKSSGDLTNDKIVLKTNTNQTQIDGVEMQNYK